MQTELGLCNSRARTSRRCCVKAELAAMWRQFVHLLESKGWASPDSPPVGPNIFVPSCKRSKLRLSELTEFNPDHIAISMGKAAPWNVDLPCLFFFGLSLGHLPSNRAKTMWKMTTHSSAVFDIPGDILLLCMKYQMKVIATSIISSCSLPEDS